MTDEKVAEMAEMTPAKLSRLSTDKDVVQSFAPLRTQETTGWFGNPPIAGMPFFFVSTPIDPGALSRLITTSNVKSVTYEGNSITFKTKNSTYHLEVLG